MNKNRVYIRRGSPLNELRGVMKCWVGLHERYAQLTQDDRIYFYTEQTHCGILSAAAWCEGFPSMIEFQQTKKSKQDLRVNVNGRMDLYIGGKDSNFYFEAKRKKINIGRLIDGDDNVIGGRLDRAFGAVASDARSAKAELKKLYSGWPTGSANLVELLFITPRMRVVHGPDVEDAVSVLQRWLSGRSEFEALAWHLTAEDEVDEEEWLNLGVVMAMRVHGA